MKYRRLPKIMVLTVMTVIALSVITVGLSHQSPKKTEIIVLSTLHTYHEQSAFYSFDTLSRIIDSLKPDVIAVELTPADLEGRKTQKVKQEYQRSVFPLADKRNYLLVPLEPAEPKFSQLVALIRGSEKELLENSPQKDEAFDTYISSLYEYLFKTWDSPFAVNSAQTDALFEVKHKYQNALYGPKQEQGWDGWNQHFMDTILESAAKHTGKRIVVLVGVEHAYWLRKRLRENKDLRFVEPEEAQFAAK